MLQLWNVQNAQHSAGRAVYLRGLQWWLKPQNNSPGGAALQVCPGSPSTHAAHRYLSSPGEERPSVMFRGLQSANNLICGSQRVWIHLVKARNLTNLRHGFKKKWFRNDVVMRFYIEVTISQVGFLRARKCNRQLQNLDFIFARLRRWFSFYTNLVQ